MKKSKLQKVLRALHEAEEKHPRSEVAVDAETGEIIAHSRSFDETVRLAQKKMPGHRFIVGRKPPEKVHACPHVFV